MFITPRNLSVKNKPYLYNMYRQLRKLFLAENIIIAPRNLSLKRKFYIRTLNGRMTQWQHVVLNVNYKSVGCPFGHLSRFSKF